METVGARIESILERQGISARELSRRAGLGETQVGMVIARYRKNPNAEVTLVTLQAIARAANVSPAWLLTGDGSPDGELVLVRDDRYPNRAAAAAFMRGQVSEAAIRRVLSMQLQADDDPPAKWWADRMELADAEVRLVAADPQHAEQLATERTERARATAERLGDATRPKLPGKKKA